MQNKNTSTQRLKNMTFSSIYPLYVEKIEKKGRTIEEMHTIIHWLTGYTPEQIKNMRQDDTSLEDFFLRANINPRAELIKGTICGYKIEEIEDPFLKKVRYLDKIVDELAKGKAIEKIMR